MSTYVVGVNYGYNDNPPGLTVIRTKGSKADAVKEVFQDDDYEGLNDLTDYYDIIELLAGYEVYVSAIQIFD